MIKVCKKRDWKGFQSQRLHNEWWILEIFDCLTTVWWSPDNCLTAWWLPYVCLMTAWQLNNVGCLIIQVVVHCYCKKSWLSFTFQLSKHILIAKGPRFIWGQGNKSYYQNFCLPNWYFGIPIVNLAIKFHFRDGQNHFLKFEIVSLRSQNRLVTGKSFSEVLILASTNPQYGKRLSIEEPVQ